MRIEPPDPKADRRRLGARGQRRSLAERDANVIPLIDIVFILILYFMLVGSLDQELIEALTPPQSRSMLAPPKKVPAVVIKQNGDAIYKGIILKDEALAAAVYAAGNPPYRVSVQADALADAARVADVLGILNRAGVTDLALITMPLARRR